MAVNPNGSPPRLGNEAEVKNRELWWLGGLNLELVAPETF